MKHPVMLCKASLWLESSHQAQMIISMKIIS